MSPDEIFAHLARSERNKIRYIGDKPARVDRVKPRLFERIIQFFFPSTWRPEFVYRAISARDVKDDSAVTAFIRARANDFEIVERVPIPLFLHVYYNEAMYCDFLFSTAPWDQLRAEDPEVFEHAEHIASKVVWSPVDMEKTNG